MKPKYKWLFFSVLIVLSVSVLIILSQHPDSESTQEKKEKEQVSFFSNIDQVQEININNSISINKQGQGWQVEEVTEKLDDLKIERTVNNVLSMGGVIMDDENIKNSGLENPWMTIDILGMKDEKITVSIGQQNEGDNYYYASITGDSNIYKVEPAIIDSIPTSADKLVYNRMVEIRPNLLEEIIIYNGEQTIELKPESSTSEEENRTNLSGWYMHQPYKGEYSVKYNHMSDMIYGVELFEKMEVVKESGQDLGTYGLDIVDFHITFKGDGVEETLLIGNPASNQSYYAKLESNDEIVTVPREIVTIYSYQAFEMVEKFVGIYALDVVESIEIKSGANEIQIDKKEDNFRINQTLIEEEKFRDLYKEIAGLSVDEEADKAISDSPKATIEYMIDLGNQYKDILIEFVEYDKDTYAVVRNGITDFLIDKSKLLELVNQINKIKEESS